MAIHNSLSELIGNTPLIKLNHVTDGVKATIAVKVEYFNPGGSSKDRIAARIIDAAEREGKLKPGGVIVEPTSGNTGVGLAMVAQQRGYRTVFVVPDKVNETKRAVLRAYGAEVVVTPTDVEPDDPRSYYRVSDRLAETIPGAFKPNQYSNPNGPLSHYETTGPEIWEATAGQITHFVAGIGTGGTITGTGRFLKEQNPHIRIVGVEPADSAVLSGGAAGKHGLQGIGAGFIPEVLEVGILDQIITVTTAQAFDAARQLAKTEGLLVGISSGAALHAALEIAKEPENAGKTIVVLLPDTGDRYLSTDLFKA